MTRRRTIIDRGRKRSMVTVDTRPDLRDRMAELEHTGGRDREPLSGVNAFGQRSHGTAIGCYHVQRLPTADEQARPPDDE